MARIDKVAFDRISLAVRKASDVEKPCLVLLHGWRQTSMAWESVLPDLGSDH